MTRSKRSVEKEKFWRSVVDEQRRGGLNIRTFCQQKAISEPSFYAWRKELQKRDAEITDADSSGRLVPVAVVNPPLENATPSSDEGVVRSLEIGTPGGFTLRFDHDTPPQTILRLLDVIAQCPTGGVQCPTAGATSC